MLVLGLGRHRETWRVVLDSPKPWSLAHCETSGGFVGWVETWRVVLDSQKPWI